MSDIFNIFIQRERGQAGGLNPRLPSLFEAGAPLADAIPDPLAPPQQPPGSTVFAPPVPALRTAPAIAPVANVPAFAQPAPMPAPLPVRAADPRPERSLERALPTTQKSAPPAQQAAVALKPAGPAAPLPVIRPAKAPSTTVYSDARPAPARATPPVAPQTKAAPAPAPGQVARPSPARPVPTVTPAAPVRQPAKRDLQAPAPRPPDVNITIGRVEVRLPAPAARPGRQPASMQPTTLDQYLGKRNNTGSRHE